MGQIQRYEAFDVCRGQQYVLYADHLEAMAAKDEQIRQLREALQAYRNPSPSLSIFHDECFLDANRNRNVDSRCDLCKAADALLEATK